MGARLPLISTSLLLHANWSWLQKTCRFTILFFPFSEYRRKEHKLKVVMDAEVVVAFTVKTYQLVDSLIALR